MRARPLLFTISLLVALSLLGCRKAYVAQQRKIQQDAITRFLETKSKVIWQKGELQYAVLRKGDSIHIEDGQTLELRFSLYMLKGKADLLQSNIEQDLRDAKKTIHPGALDLWRVDFPAKELLDGLRKGLIDFAHLNGSGWIGIPADMAYGGDSGRGIVPPDTPLVCYIEVVSYSGKLLP